MRKILVCTHGELAKGFKDSVQMIAGDIPNLSTLCVSMEDTIEAVKAMISDFIDACDQNDQKIIFTDIPGGSTTQAAFTFINSKENIHVVSGVNLGLLLEVVLDTSEPLDEALHSAVENGKETIKYLNETFGL